MYESVKSVLTLSALVCLQAGALLAQDAAPSVAPAPVTSAAVAVVAMNPFDTRIDTWIEGVIVKLDAADAKISVAGHRMAHASAHAAMLKDIATKTEGMDSSQRAAKESEIRLAWQDKMAKAATEKRAEDTEIFGSMPARGEVLVITESTLTDADFLRHEQGMASTAAPGDRVLGAPLPPARHDQATADEQPAKSTESKQLDALGAFGQLKVGEPVYVGMASGTFTNDVHAIIRRDTLQARPTTK